MKKGLNRQSFAFCFIIFATLFASVVYRAAHAPYGCETASTADLPLGMFIDSLVVSTTARFFIVALLIFLNALMFARAVVRYELNATGNHMALPLYVACSYAMFIPVASVAGVLSSTLLVLSSTQMMSSFKYKNRFATVYGSMFTLGVMVLLHSSFAILVLVAPVMLLIFDRTAREAIIGVAGLATPFIFCMFAWWTAGEGLGYIFDSYLDAITLQAPYGLVGLTVSSGLPMVMFAGLLGVLLIYSVVVSLASVLRMRTRTRRIHIYSTVLIVFIASMILVPSANIFTLGLLGTPLCQLMVSALTRNWWGNIVLYVIVLAGALALNLYFLWIPTP